MAGSEQQAEQPDGRTASPIVLDNSGTGAPADNNPSSAASSTTPPAGEGGEGEKKTPPSPTPSGANETWAREQLERRVAKLTARNKDLEARVAAGTSTPGERTEVAANQTAITDAAVEARALAIAAQREYDRNAQTAVDAGRTRYGNDEFNERVSSFKRLHDPSDPVSNRAYSDLVEAAIETGAPEKIIFELGGDLKEADRILKLSPVKRAAALAKLAEKDEKKAEGEETGEAGETVSSAPKPITTIGRRGPAHTAIAASDPSRADNLSTAAWMERRNAEATDYNKKAGRRVI